jgi:hypothetical protein
LPRRTLCLIAVALLAGCGGGGPKSDPDAIHDLLRNAAQAVADRDGGKLCGYLTPEAQQQVLQLAGGQFDAGDCAGVVKFATAGLAPLDRKQIEDAEPQNVQVVGSTATAEVVAPSPTNQGRAVQVTLQKTTDGWRVSAFTL